MTSREVAIRPLGQPSRQKLQKVGKIKIGVKVPASGNRKQSMKAIDTFRFISDDRTSLEILAEAYGGEVQPFRDDKSPYRLELITNANEIAILLPPHPLGDSPQWEKFGGKGIERRCDSVTCEEAKPGPEGKEMVPTPCICKALNVKECKPTTRLSVLLPECRVSGVWELESHSEFASDEMPTMVGIIEAAGQVGMTQARLVISSRMSSGGTRQYKVPTLVLNHTFLELVSGAATLTASKVVSLGSGEAGLTAIGPGSSMGDDDAIDAEVIDDPATEEQLENVKSLWTALPSEAAKRWVREQQQQAQLPPSATDMTRTQAQQFISILNRAFD